MASISITHASQTATKSLGVSITLSKAQCKINNGAGISGSFVLPMISTSGQIISSKNSLQYQLSLTVLLEEMLINLKSHLVIIQVKK